jgi:hypothetical protein
LKLTFPGTARATVTLPRPDGLHHAALVATTGGTHDARRAGTHTASWPSTSNANAPTTT